MPRKPWFPFYTDDFWQDENVAAMTLEEVGLYLRLLCLQWREGSIPADPERLARIAGISREAIGTLWENVSGCFQPLPDDPTRLANPRLLAVANRQTEVHRKAVESGRKGGLASKGALSDPTAKPEGASSKPQPYRESESEVTTTTTPPSPPAGETSQSDPEKPTAKSPRGKNKPRKRKTPTTPPPDRFDPSTANTEWFRKQFGVVAKSLVDRETGKFLDRHKSLGNQFVDWQAAWRTWMTNWQTDFGKRSPAGVPDRPPRANPNLVTGGGDDDG